MVRPRLCLESEEENKYQLIDHYLMGRLSLALCQVLRKCTALEATQAEVGHWPQNSTFSPSYLTTRKETEGKNEIKRIH